MSLSPEELARFQVLCAEAWERSSEAQRVASMAHMLSAIRELERVDGFGELLEAVERKLERDRWRAEVSELVNATLADGHDSQSGAHRG